MASTSAAAGFAVSGCDTTQDAAARVKIRSERTLAGREPIKVKELASDVDTKATLITGDDGTAIVVELTNTGAEPINDLPIAVSVRTEGGGEQPLNDGKDLPYFQTHSPAVAAGETATWVYVNKDKVDAAAEPVVEVGVAPDPPVATATDIPVIDVGAVTASGDSARVDVSNSVGFTQYDLAVFVWATKGDQFVAGGFDEAGDLEDGETEAMTISLIGDSKGAELHASAPPTIFK